MSENYFKILEVDKMSGKGHEAGFELENHNLSVLSGFI